MAHRLQYRRDTKANWLKYNPVLMEGEVGYETDTHHQKVGDGVSTYSELEYEVGVGNITQETGDSESLVMSQKAVSEKFTELDIYSYQFRKILNALPIEQGSYNVSDGLPFSNNTRVRTGLVSVKDITRIRVGEGFKIVQAFYYKSDKVFSRKQDAVSNNYFVTPMDDEYYVAFNFRKDVGSETFSANENFGLLINETLNDVFKHAIDLVQNLAIKKGESTTSKEFFRTNALIKGSYIMFCLADNEGAVGKYGVFGSSNEDVAGNGDYYRFVPNKWYIEKVSDKFIDNQDKWGCVVSKSNAMESANCLFKAYINIDNSIFEKLESCYNDKIYINQCITNLGLLKIEKGSYNSEDGIPYATNTRLRTPIIPIESFDSISVKEGFKIVQAFYYNSNESTSFSRRTDIVANQFEVLPKDGETHIALNFRKDDSSATMNPIEDMGIVLNGGIFESIKGLKDSIYKTELVEFPLSGYYNINTGNIDAGPYTCSKKYKISNVTKITCNVRGQGVAAGVAFFDRYEQLIIGYSTNYGEIFEIVKADFPKDAVYVAFSKRDGDEYAGSYASLIGINISSDTDDESTISFKRYYGKKMCTIGSSSTYPGEWQIHLADWLGFEFDSKENQLGVGYVRIESIDSYWMGLEYSDELPENVTQSTANMSGTDVSIWTDGNGNIWRKAFQTSKGGDTIKTNNSLNIFARAFDVKWYKPNVVFLMCYNEINYMTTEKPYGSLGTIDDEPVFTPNTSASIYASYKGIIEYITKNIPMCEIVLVSTKLNTYEIYGDVNSTISDIRNSERYRKDKIYHDAVKEIAEYYGVKFVDLFHNTGMTPWSIVDYMQGLTNVHCNSKGQLEYIANNIYKGFMS